MRVAAVAPLMIWALASAGCSKPNDQSASTKASPGTNTNAVIAVSAQSLTGQINQARSSFTNIPVEIHEAAGAAKDEATQLADQLRASLRSDDALATVATNVTADIQGDAVIIRGNVRTKKERDEVERKVRAITRSSTIKNELEVRDK